MNSKEKINRIFALDAQVVGYWSGNPTDEAMEIFLEKLSLKSREDFYRFLNDDCRWIPADSAYKHPEGKEPFDVLGGEIRTSLGQPGCFAETRSVAEVERYSWPDPAFLDFTEVLNEIKKYPDKAIFSGLWSPFFHTVCDFFGMENYFIKMYTDPKIVEAVTQHVVEYYVAANEEFFRQTGDLVQIFFFGNDFGSQKSLLISPDSFKKFVLPGMRRLIDIGKKYNKKVLFHSCGAVSKVIPLLIEAGIDGLHPLQTQAKGMDAVSLARNYKGQLAFVGGVDTQNLLVKGSPGQVKAEIKKIKKILGPNLVVSPSHEAILPNIPLENVLAMAKAACED